MIEWLEEGVCGVAGVCMAILATYGPHVLRAMALLKKYALPVIQKYEDLAADGTIDAKDKKDLAWATMTAVAKANGYNLNPVERFLLNKLIENTVKMLPPSGANRKPDVAIADVLANIEGNRGHIMRTGTITEKEDK